MSTNLLALLPELILALTGVLVMLAEPLIAPGRTRKPLGWLAILGTAGSGLAALYQLHVVDTLRPTTGILSTLPGSGNFTAFSGTIQIDAFSVFFHLLIASIVLVTLLASLDYFEDPITHAGEYFALVLFGATGMMFMTSSVELLMVFIGLEISSISTYILAGFRKGRATASEAAHQVLPPRQLRHGLLPLRHRPLLRSHRLDLASPPSPPASPSPQTPLLGWLAVAMVLIGLGFKVSAAPFHVWTPDVYQGAPSPVVGMMSTAPKAAAFAVLLRFLFNATPMYRDHWVLMIAILAVASMTIGNLGALLQSDVKRLLAYSSIAHAGYMLVAFTSAQHEAVSTVCFYTAAYAAMNVGAFLVLTQLSGFDEKLRTLDDFTGLALKRPDPLRHLRLLPALPHRNPLHRRLLRQVLRLLRGRPRRLHLARDRRPGQLRRSLLLLPAPAGRPLRPPLHRHHRRHPHPQPRHRPRGPRASRDSPRDPLPRHPPQPRPPPNPARNPDHHRANPHDPAPIALLPKHKSKRPPQSGGRCRSYSLLTLYPCPTSRTGR